MHAPSFGWRSIRVRLYLLFSLTLLGVMAYALTDAWSSWQTLQRLQRMEALEQTARSVSAVVHELQKSAVCRPAGLARRASALARNWAASANWVIGHTRP